MSSPKVIGAIIGLAVGLIVACLGLPKALLVVLFVLIGWFIGKVRMGEIDLLDIYERFRGKGHR